MKLYIKVVMLLCAVFVAYGAVDYTIQRDVISELRSLEVDLAHRHERVTRALDRELTQLMTFGADWGNWIDTYEYMRLRNPEFIETNLNPSFLESSGIELMAFVDASGRFVWRQGYAAKGHAPIPYAMLDAPGLEPDHPFLASIRDGQRAKGIVMTEHGALLLTLAPILDGNGGGPHRGAVLMGRLLTPKRISQLAEQAQVRLAVRTQPPRRDGRTKTDGPLSTTVVRYAEKNDVFR